MMDEQFEKRALEIVEKALDIDDEQKRECYVGQACHSDQKLRSRVEHFLKLTQIPDDELIRSLLASQASVAGKEIHQQEGLIAELKSHGLSLAYFLGEGGSSFVYQCVSDESGLSKFLAVKILKAEFRDSQIKQRFLREVEILSQLHHPYIVRYYRQGELSDGRPYCVMEYVRGYPLSEFDAYPNLPFREKITFLVRICEAVRYAHSMRVIHRDLKPGNILVVKEEGEYLPKLIDFGIARIPDYDSGGIEGSPMTGRFQLFGTPAYMSPEQAMGRHDQIDVRTDIFSCGVIFHELIHGRHPFPDIKASLVPVENIKQHIISNPPITRTPWALAGRFVGGKVTSKRHNQIIIGNIIQKCIQAEQGNRYNTISEIEEDLSALKNNQIPQNIHFDRSFLWSAFLHRHYKSASVIFVIACFLTYSIVQHLINVEKLVGKNQEISASRAALIENLYNQEIISAYNAYNNSGYRASLDHLNKINTVLPEATESFWEYRFLMNQVRSMKLEPIRIRNASLSIIGHFGEQKYGFIDWSNKESGVFDLANRKEIRSKYAKEYYMGAYDPDQPEYVLCGLWSDPNRLRLEKVPYDNTEMKNLVIWQEFSKGWVRLGGFGPGPSQVFLLDEIQVDSRDGPYYDYLLRILDRENGSEISQHEILQEFRPMRVNWHQINSCYAKQNRLLAFVMHNGLTNETVLVIYDIESAKLYDTVRLRKCYENQGFTKLNLFYEFSPDESVLAILQKNVLSLYDVNRKQIVSRTELTNYTLPVSLGWYDDSNIFCAYENTVRRIEIEGDQIRESDYIAGFGEPILAMIIDRDNSLVLTSHRDGSILSRNVRNDHHQNPQHITLKIPDDPNRQMLDWHFDEVNQKVAFIDSSGNIDHYTISDGRYKQADKSSLHVNMMEARFSPDARLLVFSDIDDRKLRIVDLATGEIKELDSDVYGWPPVQFIENKDRELSLIYTRGTETHPTRDLVRKNIVSGKSESMTIKNGRFPQISQVSYDRFIIEHNTEIVWDSLPFEYMLVDFTTEEVKEIESVDLISDIRATFSFDRNRGVIAGGPAFNGILEIDSGNFRQLEGIQRNESDRAVAYEFMEGGRRLAVVSNRDLKARLTIHETVNGEMLAEIPLSPRSIEFVRLKVSPDRGIITCLNFETNEFHVISPGPLME